MSVLARLIRPRRAPLPWRCQHGFHFLIDGNCVRCGYRGHGGHVEPYRSWAAER